MISILSIKKGFVFVIFGCFVVTFIILAEIYTLREKKYQNQIPEAADHNFMTVILRRREQIKTICSSDYVPLMSTTQLLSTHLYWLVAERIAYCPVFKSASSVWFENLIQLSTTNISIISTARKRHKNNLIEQVKYLGAIQPSESTWSNHVSLTPHLNLTTFMIVRHPFERLVSAYRDKLERLDLFYYEKYGKRIVYRFREQAIENLGKAFFHKSNNYGTMLKVLHGDRTTANLPSFWEFVQSVIIRLNMDEHWRPIYEYCSVCNPVQLKLNTYILKFENLSEESPAFLRHMHWADNLDQGIALNVNRPTGMSSKEVTQLYFSVLSDDDIRKLYKVYEYDFLLFNYTFKFGNLTLPIKDKVT